VIALTVAAKSVRDALFCSQYSTGALTKAMVAGALLSALLALVTGRIIRAVGPGNAVVGLLALNAAGLVLEYLALQSAPRVTALILYLHVSAVASVLVSGFWSVVNERFDPHSLRLVVSRIGLGGTLGGVVGGLAAERVAAWAGVRQTLLILVVFSLAGAITVRAVARKATGIVVLSAPNPDEPKRSGYVRRIAVFVGLTALASSLADFAFKARAMERYTGEAELMQFFALFYMGVSAATFAVQSFVTPPLLEKTDLGVGLAGTPGAVAVSGLLALALPGLPTQALLKGVDASLSGSLFRSAYEPLYTPLSAERKRPLKTLVDVVVDKIGDGAGSVLSWGLVWLAPASASSGASLIVTALALLTFALASRLYHDYVDELAESLRTGMVELDNAEIHDRTTRLTVSRTIEPLNRARLLAQIQKRAAEEAAVVAAARTSAPPRVVAQHAAPAPTPPSATARHGELSASIAALLSDDLERIRRALETSDPALTPFVIPLLDRQEVAARAMTVLANFGTRITGQLADALRDSQRFSPAVRRRLARVITSNKSTWSAAALLSALDDPDYDVRGQVLEGVEELRQAGIALPITRESILAAALRELGRTDCPSTNRRVEHPLLLLGWAFDPEAFRLAARALMGEDEKLRGTALEYLDNVLPEPVRSALLGAVLAERLPRSQRTEHELVADLKLTLG
jgi:AAA family ATP:ADP antiporter